MDQREQRNQENPSQPSSNVNSKEDQPPRKPLGGGSVGGGGGGSGSDRIKRDEWSEGAVATLLEAYESKWILRNRAKLKGQDWEDVARYVSSRVNNTKSPKTQTQCKNKIESMKKRYRSESTTADNQHQTSSWPLFSRLDHLLRGTGTSGSGVPTTPPPSSVPQPLTFPAGPTTSSLKNPTFILVESGPVPPPPPPAAPPLVIEMESSPQFNCPDQIAKEDRAIADETRLQNQPSDKKTILDTDSTSTPALYDNNDNDRRDDKRKKMKVDLEKRKRRRRGGDDHDHDRAIADSIQWLAEVVVRSEQARMDTIRELERMRIEAEAKRGEMDLKRTEIISNTQLEIARLFASSGGGGGGGNKKH